MEKTIKLELVVLSKRDEKQTLNNCKKDVGQTIQDGQHLKELHDIC